MGEQFSMSLIKIFLIKFSIFLFLIGIMPFIVIGAIVYRTSVKYAAKLFRKDLSNMVTAIGNVLAGDNLYESPMANIVLPFVVEGNLDCEKTKEETIKNVLEPSFGLTRYPELKQYPIRWGGYHFWKNDKNFNLDNHFKIIDDNKLHNEDDLKSLSEESLRKKWVRNRPLWEVTFIKNYIPSHSFNSGPHTAIIWRSHHSLADGYSLLYFFTESLGQNKVDIARPDLFNRTFLQKFAYCIQFPLKVLWERSEHFMTVSKRYSLSAPKGDCSTKVELNSDVSCFIPISKVRDVKRHYKTSFAAVQFAALAGALQQYHLKRNIPLPDFYPCATILPHLGHKLYKFRNCMGGALTLLPTSESDPCKRLMHSQRDYDNIKQSTYPVASFYIYSLVGCNIRSILKRILRNQYLPMAITSFPGQLVQGSFLGHKVVEGFAFAGPLEGNIGIVFALVSYLDGFRISGAARSSVMTKEDVSEIINLFVQNLDELHNMAALDEKKMQFQTVEIVN